jgi:acyl-CoA reductase-like NAD-dependent aldehyde dehydrogenase
MPVRTHPPFVGGRYLPARGRPAETVRSPWSDRPLGRVAEGSDRDLTRAIAMAERAAAALAGTDRTDRAALLERIGAAVTREARALARLICRDAGKPITLAEGEVGRCQTVFRLAAEEARRFGVSAETAEQDPRGGAYTARIERFPAGIVGAISPFNFPLNLVAHKLAPALAAGCPVILKPPPQAPLTAFRLAELVHAAGAPPGTFQVLHLPIPVAERLATDPRLAVLSFTGSDRVGWRLKGLAGRKRVILELGGNAPTIVHGDTPDLPAVAERVAWGAFAYAGQVCIKVQRLLVEQRIRRRFTDLVVRATRAIRSGDPADPRTLVGPLIDDAAADRVGDWVREAVAGGARPLVRGRRQGRLLTPVVLADPDPSMKVSCREVFGPVLTVESYRSWDEALEMANASDYGLQAGVYTRDAGRVREAFRRLEYGGVIVNDIPTVRLDHLPYGGVKASGFGREGVRSALAELTEERVLLERR